MKDRILQPIALPLVLALLIPMNAIAASFDCSKAANSVERMICGDTELSRLDEALSQTYAVARESAADIDGLQKSQRRWLTQRNACSDARCVKASYEARLAALGSLWGMPNCDPAKGMVHSDICFPEKPKVAADPFDDKKLTCAEMRRYPERIFTDSIDLGSGSGSPIEVDYSCKESLASLLFLQKLKALTEEIRADRGPQICTGSIVYAQARYYHFGLLMAGFAPQKLLERKAMQEKWAYLSLQALDANLYGYFERWAYESVSNFDLYSAYMGELARAKIALARHYSRTFRLSRESAEELAQLGTRLFVERAAGSFPRDSIPETQRVLNSARVVRGSQEKLRSGLDGMTIDYIRIALNIALVLKRPSPHIEMLIERAESLNYGNESPLFFALRSPSNVRLLLERGAEVNYANSFGKTALFYSVGFNDHAMTELLLTRGAAVNHRYDYPKSEERPCDQVRRGRTPLMHAAQHADLSMVKLLLKHGARLDDRDEAEENATAYALRHGREEAASYLKSLGAVAPLVEEQLARQRKFTACLQAGGAKKLQGPALSEFLRGCFP